MKVKAIPSEWILRKGRRLDVGPYMSGALEAEIRLKGLPVEKHRLGDLTLYGDEGIFHAGREGRTWVEDAKHGVPFLSSSDILKADLSTLPLISRKQVERNPKFTIREGWTLITRSGTVGRTVYARLDMDGMACSEHVMRVIPNPKIIPPGYLYAYLSSKFGVPLVVSGTYGAIIQHIEPHHIVGLPVPRLGDDVERQAHELVEEAAELRCQAERQLAAASEDIEKEFKPPLPKAHSDRSFGQCVSSARLVRTLRLEAYFHNPLATAIDRWAEGHSNGAWRLGEIANIYDVPLFKHIYVEAPYGLPFYTSGDLFRLERRPLKYLSRKRTKGLDKYILKKGWVLLARSGQLGGIIGRPQFADSALDGATTSDHVIRIVPNVNKVPPGFIYAYLATPSIGYPLLTRTMTGASIPALWPAHLIDVPVVRASRAFMAGVDRCVRSGFEARVRAMAIEDEARAVVERAIEAAS